MITKPVENLRCSPPRTGRARNCGRKELEEKKSAVSGGIFSDYERWRFLEEKSWVTTARPHKTRPKRTVISKYSGRIQTGYSYGKSASCLSTGYQSWSSKWKLTNKKPNKKKSGNAKHETKTGTLVRWSRQRLIIDPSNSKNIYWPTMPFNLV